MFLLRFFVGYGTLLLLVYDFGLTQAGPGAKFVYEVHTELTTWEEANDFCVDEGKTMVFSLSQQEHKDLREHIQTHNLLPKTTTSGYWLGGRYNGTAWVWVKSGIDVRTGVAWTWDSPGVSIRSDIVFMPGWHPSEPNRTKQPEKNGEKQDCLELQYRQENEFRKALSWNAMWCDEKRGFVCQYLAPNQG